MRRRSWRISMRNQVPKRSRRPWRLPKRRCMFSMTGQIRKNQHYVAQFLLGGFDIESGGATPKINIFDVQRNSLRFDQAVKEVFAQNYFYDKDNQIENFISEHIEGPAAEQINKLRNGDFASLNSRDTRLIKFLCCQNSRTVEARRDALNWRRRGRSSPPSSARPRGWSP